MPSPQFEALIQLLKAAPNSNQLSVEQQRSGMETMAAQTPLPTDVYAETISAETVAGLLLAPSNANDQQMALYVHGGFFTLGSSTTHRDLAWRLGEVCGTRVLLPDYRRAPEHPFPAAVDDITTTYHWLLDSGLSAENLILIGDSAGANIMLSALVGLRDAAMSLPRAAIALSPWVDLTLSAESLHTNVESDPLVTIPKLEQAIADYAGDISAEDPRLSPLFADLSGLPPLFVQAGTGERLLDDARRLADRATAAGVDVVLDEWEEMFHGWHAMAAVLPESQDALTKLGKFAREQLAS